MTTPLLRLFPLLLLPSLVEAEVVRDVIAAVGGTRPSGTLTVRVARSFTSARGVTVLPTSRQFSIRSGVISVTLEPNVGATPLVPYEVTYSYAGADARPQFWMVPASTPALRLADVIVERPAVAPLTIQPSQITAGGATPGQFLGFVAGVGWTAVDPPSGGTGGGGPSADVWRMVAMTGARNGANPSFTIPTRADVASLLVFRNGLFQTPAVDFNLVTSSGAATGVTFVAGAIPQTGDILTAVYRERP